jgi:hypothetical protein
MMEAPNTSETVGKLLPVTRRNNPEENDGAQVRILTT